MNTLINPDQIDIIVDGSFNTIITFVDGNLVNVSDEPDEVAQMIARLIDVFLTDEEEELESHDQLEVFTQRVGVVSEQRNNITTTGSGMWNDIPNTLAEILAL